MSELIANENIHPTIVSLRENLFSRTKSRARIRGDFHSKKFQRIELGNALIVRSVEFRYLLSRAEERDAQRDAMLRSADVGSTSMSGSYVLYAFLHSLSLS